VDAALARITVPGEAPLVLYRETPGAGAAGPVPLAILTLRPRLAPGLDQMREECRRARVGPLLVPANEGGHDRDADEALARRAGIPIAPADGSLMAAIDQVQNAGGRVAVLADSAAASEAFAACDLAIALTSGRGGRFPARADLLAPELSAVAAIIDAAARRDAAVRDAVLLSAVSNVIGVVWGIRGGPGVERASRGVYIAALTALSASWARLRGGARTSSVRACLVDPRPERWGRRSVADVLTALHSSPDGVSTAAAEAKQRGRPLRVAAAQGRGRMALAAIADQLRSPMIWLLAGSAGLSLFLGHPADFALIGATILLNVTVGVWQEWQAGSAAEALTRLGSVTARVLRDGVLVTLPAGEVVVGDVLQLASGDRVAADARVIEASRLEVGEAALTGESLPVLKVANGASDAARVVLDGSGITAGAGRAVVFAVGSQTRLGATAAALAIDDTEKSPLGLRLARLLAQFLPIAAGAGVIVAAAGMFRGAAPAPQIALGATLALAAVPEGLPLLAGMAEVAVARRLAGRNALVRRLSAVEALGRVDVACTDKTGTLTEGRLALALVCGEDGCTGGGDPEALEPGGALSPAGRRVLLAGAIASPHPDAPDAVAHLTDVAVVAGAALAGLADTVRAARRDEEASFDPAQRAFHATRAGGRLYVKGAPEVLAPRCTGLDEAQRRRLLDRAEDLARRGLRVLMVAEGADGPVDDPSNLTSLGFLGIRDPLRAGVPDAVRRCREAGIRILMLTGDHPATARAIARDAGLLPLPGDGVDDADGAVLTGAVLAEKCNGDLDEAIDRAVVIARATPLDKLRIIESLQRRGHVVAMTGDGVNDAPALRLADVGVAMGRGGTEVARQAASVVLADDDFATLVEGLVEGRGFWRNMRRALGLLVGGNLGELGLVVGASVLGLAAPLTLRQILAVNLITDALPALSVALQAPEHRRLAGLSREGASALDMSLRRDVVRRGAATAIPALASYGFLLARGTGLPEARSVAFASIVMTQLAQTLRAGWSEGGLTPVVLGAVGGSASLLLAALTIPPLRDVLTLALPSPLGWALIGAGSLTAAIAAGTSGNQQRTVAPSSPRTPRLLPPATPRMIAASSA
jgi:magnesium-transporting ATPase (P-type)